MNAKYRLALPALALVAVLIMGAFATPAPHIAVPEEPQAYGTVIVEVQRAGSDEWVLVGHSHNTVVNIGKEFLEDLMCSTNSSVADYISLSTNSTAPDVAWTQIPDEITTGGLNRQQGTITDTGTGTWNVTKEFTATATHTDVQLTGLQWASSGDGNLYAANQFTAVTLQSGDKIKVTWQMTASG